jgi:hypothetical protein
VPIPGNATPLFADVLAGLLSGVSTQLAGLPAPLPSVSVTEATPKSVGLSNLVGLDNPGGLQFATIKGGRLDVGLQVGVEAGDAAGADAALLAAHATLLDHRPQLRALGFLKFEPGVLAPVVETSGVFRRAGSYRALYEYRYTDVDGAASLIARIPVDSDLDSPLGGLDPSGHEAWVVTGPLLRWDREGQSTLRVRGPGQLLRFSAVAYMPGPLPSPVSVTLTRTYTGALGAPAVAASLADLAASAHASITFPTLADFLNLFAVATEEVELGDWDLDTVADRYALRDLTLTPVITLPRSIDRLEISVAQPAPGWVGDPSVLYLRTHGA